MLIPTFRYRDKIVRAVRSALESGAGEIIVTDDRSGDGTIEALAQFSDPRLRVEENERNLGLWENHLHALCRASKPWIKFIQADDYLLPGGLAHYAAVAAPGVTVVWGAPTVHDDVTGDLSFVHRLTQQVRLSPKETFAALVRVGWILGSPSHMMLRADAIERDPAAWRTQISADLVVGAIAAARGDTVLIPPGAIAQGLHPQQDANTEGLMSALRRLCNSVSYLLCRNEPELRHFAMLWILLSARPAISAVVRGSLSQPSTTFSYLAHLRKLLGTPTSCDWADAWRSRQQVADAISYRRNASRPFNLDVVVQHLDGACQKAYSGFRSR